MTLSNPNQVQVAPTQDTAESHRKSAAAWTAIANGYLSSVNGYSSLDPSAFSNFQILISLLQAMNALTLAASYDPSKIDSVQELLKEHAQFSIDTLQNLITVLNDGTFFKVEP